MGKLHLKVLGKMVPVWVAVFRLLKKGPSLEMAPNLVMTAMRCGALQTESLRFSHNYQFSNTDINAQDRHPKTLLLRGSTCTSRPHTESFRVQHVLVNQEALKELNKSEVDLRFAAQTARASCTSRTTAARSSTDSEEHYSTAASSIGTPKAGNSSACSSSPSPDSSTTSDRSADRLEVFCDAVPCTRDVDDSKEEIQEVMEANHASSGVAASGRPRHGSKLCFPTLPMSEPIMTESVMELANSRCNSNIGVKTARNDCKSRRPSSILLRPRSSALDHKQMCRQQNGSSLDADMAVVQYSEDPLSDFASSIALMVVVHQLRDHQDLEVLFSRYLRLNAPEHHRTIALAFLHAMESLSSFDQHLETPSQQSHNPFCAHLR